MFYLNIPYGILSFTEKQSNSENECKCTPSYLGALAQNLTARYIFIYKAIFVPTFCQYQCFTLQKNETKPKNMTKTMAFLQGYIILYHILIYYTL